MSSNPKIKAVAPEAGTLTPEAAAKIIAEYNERRKARAEEDKQVAAAVALQMEANKGKIENLRYEIFKNRKLAEPFNMAAQTAYDDLQAIVPEGMSKIRFNEEEEAKFTNRMHNEHKAGAK